MPEATGGSTNDTQRDTGRTAVAEPVEVEGAPPAGSTALSRADRWSTRAFMPGWARPAMLVVMLGALLGMSFGLGSYHVYVLGLICVHIIVTVGLAILFGYAGLLSVGQAGFVAIGAYTTSLVILHSPINAWIAVAIGGVVAAIVGLLVGIPALRLSPLYIAAVTFGFGEIVRIAATQWKDVTNGSDGLTLPLIETADVVRPLLIVTAGMVAAGYAIVRSRPGRAMKSVRDSEIAARALGVHTSYVKTLAFGIGAFYAGVAGGFFGLLTGHVSPDSFRLQESLFYLTAVIVGGLGTIGGPILGAVGLAILVQATQKTGLYRELISGAILLMALLVMPRGIAGVWDGVTRRLHTITTARSLLSKTVRDGTPRRR